MKKNFLFLITIVLLLTSCGEQSLKEQDEAYYSNMRAILNDLDNAIGEVTPSFKEYLEDNSKTEHLAIDAEKLRKKIIALQKRLNAIKPVPGTETTYKKVVESFDDYNKLAISLVRVSEGQKELIDSVDYYFQQGASLYVDYIGYFDK